MSLQLVLLIGLVLTALLYAVAIFLLRRKGMRTTRWYARIGVALLALVVFSFAGVLFHAQGWAATVAISGGIASIVGAVQWRPPTGQGKAP